MITIDIQVSRSKVKVKDIVDRPYLVQIVTQGRFAPEASNLVS